ncbi:MAG: glycosyltransferase [Candidatus Wolfebacteria bacterium]|nr:glycosyltransferase [Candidatus Wolfebacteria bacterium]
MKIAIFSDTFYPRVNGVANVAFKSAEALGDIGHEVRVFTVSEKSEEYFCDVGNGKFKVSTSFSLPFWGYPEERFSLPYGSVIRRIRDSRPDVIHTHTPFAVGWEAVLAAKLFGIPLIGTHHTFYDHYLKHVKLDYKWIKIPSWKYVVGYYNQCNLILSPSQSLTDELIEHGLKKPAIVIPNPVDTELFVPVPDAPKKKALKKKFGIPGPSIVYMGRVSYEKNIAQLVKAAGLLVKKIPGMKFVIIGDGPEIQNLRELVYKLGIKDSVIFLGFLRGQDLVEALQANDIFVTASKSENQPLSVIEAMAAGLPVVAVSALGIPEIVQDGVNGYLTHSDMPDELADKISGLWGDKKNMKKFSLASRSISLHYSQDKVARILEAAYKKLLIK